MSAKPLIAGAPGGEVAVPHDTPLPWVLAREAETNRYQFRLRQGHVRRVHQCTPIGQPKRSLQPPVAGDGMASGRSRRSRAPTRPSAAPRGSGVASRNERPCSAGTARSGQIPRRPSCCCAPAPSSTDAEIDDAMSGQPAAGAASATRGSAVAVHRAAELLGAAPCRARPPPRRRHRLAGEPASETPSYPGAASPGRADRRRRPDRRRPCGGGAGATRIRHAEQTGELVANLYVLDQARRRVALDRSTRPRSARASRPAYTTLAAEELERPSIGSTSTTRTRTPRCAPASTCRSPAARPAPRRASRWSGTPPPPPARCWSPPPPPAGASPRATAASTAATWSTAPARPRTASSRSSAARERVPGKPPLKPAKEFTLIGKTDRRVDARAKIDGTAAFGIDVAVPGMVHAVAIHGPVFGARPQAGHRRRGPRGPGVIDVDRALLGRRRRRREVLAGARRRARRAGHVEQGRGRRPRHRRDAGGDARRTRRRHHRHRRGQRRQGPSRARRRRSAASTRRRTSPTPRSSRRTPPSASPAARPRSGRRRRARPWRRRSSPTRSARAPTTCSCTPRCPAAASAGARSSISAAQAASISRHVEAPRAS